VLFSVSLLTPSAAAGTLAVDFYIFTKLRYNVPWCTLLFSLSYSLPFCRLRLCYPFTKSLKITFFTDSTPL
jgi:hypothetical protein